MVNYFLKFAFLFFVVLVARAQQEQDYLCSGKLTIDHAVGAAFPVDFRNLNFYGSVDSSIGHVELVNNSAQTIRYYLVVFELFDSAGKYILSVPVFNTAKNQKVPFTVGFEPWVLVNWPGNYFEPIRPKASARKAFFIPLTALTCPATARISMIQLRYEDGTEFRWSSPPVLTSSILIEAAMVDAEGYGRWMPLTTSGTIRVDSAGRGHLKTSSDQGGEFEHWLEQEISAWKFFPSSVDGRLIPGEIPFLLIFGDTSESRIQLDLLKQKGWHGAILVLAAIPPGSSFGDTWALSAGSQVAVAAKQK
jgi:hypothetical protein